MSNLAERIDQFRKMANDNPDDELAHYRLGQLLAEDGKHEDALGAYNRTLEISPNFSKVFQLLGQSYLALNRKDDAIETWTKGWKVADERGDKMPRDEMAKLLKTAGAPIPEPVKQVDLSQPDTGFRCQRPGCPYNPRARQLPGAPLPDAVYQRIYQEICTDCWNEWFKNYSIKVVNELRLDLSSEFGQQEYDKHMYEFMGFEAPTQG